MDELEAWAGSPESIAAAPRALTSLLGMPRRGSWLVCLQWP